MHVQQPVVHLQQPVIHQTPLITTTYTSSPSISYVDTSPSIYVDSTPSVTYVDTTYVGSVPKHYKKKTYSTKYYDSSDSVSSLNFSVGSASSSVSLNLGLSAPTRSSFYDDYPSSSSKTYKDDDSYTYNGIEHRQGSID